MKAHFLNHSIHIAQAIFKCITDQHKNIKKEIQSLFFFSKFIHMHLHSVNPSERQYANLSPSLADQYVIYNTGRMSMLRLTEHCRQ